MRRLRSILEDGRGRGRARHRRGPVILPPMRAARRITTLACAAALAVGVAACGEEAHPRTADANNNGGYVDAGPITYQLQVSRVLNPYGHEDSQYVAGLPSGVTPTTPDQSWYGVFLWAKNQTHKPAADRRTTSSSSTPRATSTTRSSSTRRQPLRLDLAEPGAAADRAQARHDGELRPHPGRPAAVQDRQHGLQQPSADARDPRHGQPAAGDDLARSVIGRARPAALRILLITGVALAAAGARGRPGGAGARLSTSRRPERWIACPRSWRSRPAEPPRPPSRSPISIPRAAPGLSRDPHPGRHRRRPPGR